jgi:hypothetical protein
MGIIDAVHEAPPGTSGLLQEPQTLLRDVAGQGDAAPAAVLGGSLGDAAGAGTAVS